jgi:glycosyltransferase involved in cell wall biosynthesis
MKQGFLIPVYRHGKTACSLAERLAAPGMPVIIVDDGNDEETRNLLADCAAKTPGVELASLKKNSGKGGAVICGLKKAAELGLTHVLQIDADGQHDEGKTAFFLEESAKHPGMIICGYPEFDETAPKGRVSGRKISNFWASVVTLSTELKDVLCGFRVYPVDASLRITRCPFLDKRMGFDPEIMVRLYWSKVYPVFHPIKVSYPPGGVSNFHAVRDNIRISLMFSRLFIGMILRSPLLIVRKIKRGKK